ncbi:MAG TPA: hypothetical protein VJP79_06515 [Nitrososphaera sp.]|nr:hypothetical protein [Nitrososphaera sp.]
MPIDAYLSIKILHKKQESPPFESINFRENVFRIFIIFVATVPMGEASIVGRTSREQPLSYVELLSEHGWIGYSDDDLAISDGIGTLRIVSLSCCHYLDNHHLIYCRALEALLVTNEHGLAIATRMEGVMTCTTENFRIYH